MQDFLILSNRALYEITAPTQITNAVEVQMNRSQLLSTENEEPYLGCEDMEDGIFG